MHNIISPILGFEKYKTIEVKVFDRFFSKLILDEEQNVCMSIINEKFLSGVHLELEEEILTAMHIQKQTQYDIYFIMVHQEPIENSVVNLAAPIIINHDEKCLGQFVPQYNKFLNTCTIKELCPI
jgi:flagellar assembly factor FliW